LSKSMTRSVVLNWIKLGLRMGVGFALLPYILRHVGATGYGYYLLLISIFGYGLVLDMGFNAVVIRYVARHAATGDHNALNRILGVVFGFYTLLSITILGIVILLAVHPMRWMLPKDATPNFHYLILLAGMLTATMFHQLGWTSVVRARERFDLSNYIQIFGLVIRTFVIVYFLAHGYGIIVVFIADLAEVLVNGIIHRAIARVLFPEIQPDYFGVRKADIQIVTGYGVWVLFNSLAQQIRYRAHSIIIAAFLPAEAITHYGVAGRMQSYLVNITNNMTTVIRARLSFLEGANDWAAIRTLYLRALRLVSAIALTLTGVLFLESHDFFVGWLGAEYAQSGLLMRVLIPGITVDMIMTVCIVLVYATSRHRPLTFILLGEAASILLSSILLIQSHGLVGVAIGISASMLLFKGLILPVYAARTLELPHWTWIKEGLLPSFSVLPICLLLGILLRTQWSGGNLFVVLIRCAVLSIPFALLMWVRVLRNEDREIVISRIQRLMGA